jgi:hypothetical protein
MVAGFAEVDREETLVAAACNHPNLVLPFTLDLIRFAG